MAANVLIRECPASISDDVTAYWNKKLPRIERLLQRIPADQRVLRFHLHCTSYGYESWAVLVLPTGTLVARPEPPARDARAAVDAVADQLTLEVRRHKEYARHDFVYRRKRRRDREFNAITAHLSALRRKDNRRGFFELLRPHMRQLQDHARRELILAQLEGIIQPGELTINDLLDEVIVRAWDEWHKRPRDQALDQWLITLLHDYLDEKGVSPADEKPPDTQGRPSKGRKTKAKPQAPLASIYERVREGEPRAPDEDSGEAEINPDGPFAAENEWVIENNPYWPFVNPLTLDETLPDESSVEPWKELADDEMRQRIVDELKRFPRNQRRAFMLHALDGWTIEEIAHGQNRTPEEVRADIEAVRSALRQRLAKTGEMP